jgi:[acyl-carrier-protein] S-malonyltransferase
MGKEIAENIPAANKVFEEADAALGFSISRLCFEGPAEELQLTENTQPAILAVSIAALEALKHEGSPQPEYVLGHSLGEYSALVAIDSLSFRDAIRVVRARGQYMQEAVPVGSGAMAAILGLSLEEVQSLCDEAAQGEVCSPANINSPKQIVIAGQTHAVARAIESAKKHGAKRAVALKVSAPFHCSLMLPAQLKLTEDLNRLVFENVRRPLVTNVDAQILLGVGERARDALIRQVSSPVRWLESIELLIREGVDTFVEVGPGKVLSGLIRQISREVECLNVEDLASLKQASANL